MATRGMAVETATDCLAQAIGLQVATRLLAETDRILIVAEDDVLTGADAIAAHLGVARRHVDRHAGVTIPERRIGNKLVASKAALARWLADGLVS